VGDRIELRSATPSDGWSMKIEKPGPERVEVTFGQGEQETEVRAECEGGVPRFEVETDD
jgi:hypothetical protein